MRRLTAIGPWRAAAMSAAAAVAMGLLATLALTGSPLGLRNFVPFRPLGVMSIDPAGITRLEIRSGPRRAVLVREGGRWRPAGREDGPQDGISTSTVDAALGFLRDSGPVRTLSRTEYTAADLRDFGLDPPALAVTLSDPSGPRFHVEFGGLNPMRSAQYVRVRGRDDLYLLPRFVGREWEQAGAR